MNNPDRSPYISNNLLDLELMLNTDKCNCICHDPNVGLLSLNNKKHECCLNSNLKIR